MPRCDCYDRGACAADLVHGHRWDCALNLAGLLPGDPNRTEIMPDPYAPTITAHTLPLDRLCQVRHLTRELDRLLGQLRVSHLSQSAADLIEGARASNAATRTLLRHAGLPLEQAAPERCTVHAGTELCSTCGSPLSLCVCPEDRS